MKAKDPIYKVAHVIRLLRQLTPADRWYAVSKAGEQEPPGQSFQAAAALHPSGQEGTLFGIQHPPDHIQRAVCRHCNVPIANHEAAGIWIHLPEGTDRATTYCQGNEGPRAEP